MWLNLRHAVRRLRRSPVFTLAAIVTLGLGIATATAAFAVIDGVLVRPLPFRDPGRLVWVWSTHTDRDRAFFSIPDFVDIERRANTLDGIAGIALWGVNLSSSDAARPAERLAGARMTPSAFGLLGVQAALGRVLLPDDDPHAVVLGGALWRRRFQADPAVVGRGIVLDGETHTVVGVLPESFQLPNVETDLIAPLDFATDPRREQRGSNFLRAFARLAPGTPSSQARDDLAAIVRDLARTYPATDAKTTAPRLVPIDDELVGAYRPTLALLAAAVLAVLAVACANFAGLSLARSIARRGELAIRTALGATRGQLARLLFLESALVAGIAGALGALAAPWLVAWLRAAAPAEVPRAAALAIGGRELGFAAGATVVCALLVGTAPALRAVRTRVRRARRGLRAVLTVAQLAVSLVLLASAGQLTRGAARLAATDPGFDPRDASAVRFALPRGRYATPDAIETFMRRLAERAAELPGVERAATASLLPLSGASARTDFLVVGHPPASTAEVPGAQWRFVGPGYFETLRVPLRAGRTFAEADDARARPVVIVDAALARNFLHGADPVGAHLVIDDGVRPRDVEVVGVVGDVAHFRLEDGATPTIYVPIAQLPSTLVGALAANASLVVRVHPGQRPPALDDLVAGLDSGVAASTPRAMTELVAATLAARRLALTLVAVFGVVALLLAVTGLAALVATSVAEERREIGVRLALGGTSQAIVRSIVAAAARLVGIGWALGIGGAFAVARLGAVGDAGDPLPLAGASAVLAAAALLAAWIPARRAAGVDPMVALRAD